MQAQVGMARPGNAGFCGHIKVVHPQSVQRGKRIGIEPLPPIAWQSLKARIGRTQRVLPDGFGVHAPRFEEGLQLLCRFGREHAALDLGLVVELGVGKHVDDRPGRTGARVRGTKNHAFQPRVQHGTAAHGAGLQGDKQFTSIESVIAKGCGGGTHRQNFGVGAGVVCGNRRVAAAGNELAVFDHHGAHRNLPLLRGQARLVQRQAHPVRIGVADIDHAEAAPSPSLRIQWANPCSPGPPASYISSMRACASGRC